MLQRHALLPLHATHQTAIKVPTQRARKPRKRAPLIPFLARIANPPHPACEQSLPVNLGKTDPVQQMAVLGPSRVDARAADIGIARHAHLVPGVQRHRIGAHHAFAGRKGIWGRRHPAHAELVLDARGADDGAEDVGEGVAHAHAQLQVWMRVWQLVAADEAAFAAAPELAELGFRLVGQPGGALDRDVEEVVAGHVLGVFFAEAACAKVDLGVVFEEAGLAEVCLVSYLTSCVESWLARESLRRREASHL